MRILVTENIKLSIASVKAHMLRTVLTVLIIALGITALIGILTAIDSIKSSLTSNFTRMGANTFTIRNRPAFMHSEGGNHNTKPKNYPAITYNQATDFADNFNFPDAVSSIFIYASRLSTLKYASVKSNPNIPVIGTDNNFLVTSGNEVSSGRNFSPADILQGSPVVIIGEDVKNTLFKHKENPIGKIISIGASKYMVIGLLKSKGASMGMENDNVCYIPVTNAKKNLVNQEASYSINVMTKTTLTQDNAIGEATAMLRKIRKIPAGESDNFDISKSNSLAEMLIENIKYVTIAATIIGLITLAGAAIGLMNIMLVTVTERTREIGIRKAMGATPQIIRNQFLIEAIVICQLGGILGIILGILVGNIVSLLIGGAFIVPWLWIISGVILCIIVGLISGIYPAMKASHLNPIDALRFE